MEYSLPAWLGAFAGTVVAVAIYIPSIRILERRMHAQAAPATPELREKLADRLSILRRFILGFGIAIFATLGYWIGKAIAAAGGAPPLH